MKLPLLKPRNAYALHAMMRKGGAMKDRRTKRQNRQSWKKEEY